MPAGNSTAPSTLPKTKLLFLRKTPEVALKQADILFPLLSAPVVE